MISKMGKREKFLLAVSIAVLVLLIVGIVQFFISRNKIGVIISDSVKIGVSEDEMLDFEKATKEEIKEYYINQINKIHGYSREEILSYAKSWAEDEEKDDILRALEQHYQLSLFPIFINYNVLFTEQNTQMKQIYAYISSLIVLTIIFFSMFAIKFTTYKKYIIKLLIACFVLFLILLIIMLLYEKVDVYEGNYVYRGDYDYFNLGILLPIMFFILIVNLIINRNEIKEYQQNLSKLKEDSK